MYQFLNYVNANSMDYFCQNSLHCLHYFEVLSKCYHKDTDLTVES